MLLGLLSVKMKMMIHYHYYRLYSSLFTINFLNCLLFEMNVFLLLLRSFFMKERSVVFRKNHYTITTTAT